MKLRILFTSLFAILISLSVNAQQWLQNLPKEKSQSEYTLFDYRQAFNSYWDKYDVKGGYYYVNGVKKKAGGWKQYLRWDYFQESQINPSTGLFPKTTAEEQFNLFYAKNPASKSTSGDWTQMGPDNSWGGYSGIGRLNCIAFHPSNTNTYWVGAPAGGLWVTTNNGTSWTCLTDENEILGVSDIVISSDYATSHTIYIATGDKDAFDNISHGILKSTDGGVTWNTTGLAFAPSDYIMVNRILADPSNVNTLIAATTIGVFKTTNGGADWSLLSDNDFIDMEYKPGNFNTLYGSTNYGGIFVSTNGGTSWTQSLELMDGQRTELAVSANQAAWVYAVVCDYEYGLLGVYKSTNSGTSFNEVLSGYSLNLLGWESYGDDYGGQGWYDLSIAASPVNANIVLVGGVNTWKSLDGGTNWEISNHWWGDGVPAVHADKHMLSFRSNGNLFECNDGGVYYSGDNGTTWDDKTNGIITSQMYKLGNSATDQDLVITGLQDNGTKLYSYGEWYDVKGGDGMECLIDYSNADIQYGTYVYGQIDRTTDMWSSDIVDISPDGYPDGAWVTPYIIDPVNPQILYVGYADVYKSTNRGDSWTMISNLASEDKIRSMAIAPSNTQVLYIADLTHIWKTTNGGTNWTNITGSLPVSDAYIRYVTIKNNDPNTVWVTMSGFTSPGVYQTTNAGTTWTNISSGLPTIPVNTIVQNKLNTGTVELYCGTDYGVYFKNGSNNWEFFSDGLPKVVIGELEIWYGATSATSKLRAATYGRGLWESDLYSVTTPIAGTAAGTSPICSGSTSTLTLTGSAGNIQWQQSADGTTGWANVTGGSGATTTSYTTPALTVTTYYRAEVSLVGYTTVYSNVKQVVVNVLPSAAGIISGTTPVCQGQNTVNYSVAAISNATSYVWTLPSGATGSSTTNSINVNYGTSAVSGNVTVKGSNTCGFGQISNFAVTVNPLPSNAGTITGSTSVCQGQNTVNYSVPEITNADSYIWTLPSGASGSSTTSSIVVDYGLASSSGNITVKGNNSCGNGIVSSLMVTVKDLPATPTISLAGNILHSDAASGNQWYYEGVIIPGATGQDYTALQDGEYYVIVTLLGCSSESSNIINVTASDINNAQGSKNLKIYPNPANNLVTVTHGTNCKQINIFDVLGQQIYSVKTTGESTEIDLSSFKSGAYVLQCIFDEESVMQKLIIKKLK